MGRADFWIKRGTKLKRWQFALAVGAGVGAAYLTVYGLDPYSPFGG